MRPIENSSRCQEIRNPLEERLLDQEQACASYTPPFFGAVHVAYLKA